MASAGEKRKADVSLEDLVAEALECPVCLETIKDPPVFICTNGHELCQKCREPLKAEGKPCPVCQGELLDVRNRFAEKALDKLPKTQCKHNRCTNKSHCPIFMITKWTSISWSLAPLLVWEWRSQFVVGWCSNYSQQSNSLQHSKHCLLFTIFTV